MRGDDPRRTISSFWYPGGGSSMARPKTTWAALDSTRTHNDRCEEPNVAPGHLPVAHESYLVRLLFLKSESNQMGHQWIFAALLARYPRFQPDDPIDI